MKRNPFLNKREIEVLKLRFGLENDKRHTLREIASVFKVTPERIRQIEAKALRKLESFSKGGRLRFFTNTKFKTVPFTVSDIKCLIEKRKK